MGGCAYGMPRNETIGTFSVGLVAYLTDMNIYLELYRLEYSIKKHLNQETSKTENRDRIVLIQLKSWIENNN